MRRLALGLSQREIGEALDISFQQVQKYELGLSEISAGRLYQLVQVLGCRGRLFSRRFARAPELDECLQLSRAFIAVRNANVRKIIIDLVMSLAAEFALLKE